MRKIENTIDFIKFEQDYFKRQELDILVKNQMHIIDRSIDDIKNDRVMDFDTFKNKYGVKK